MVLPFITCKLSTVLLKDSDCGECLRHQTVAPDDWEIPNIGSVKLQYLYLMGLSIVLLKTRHQTVSTVNNHPQKQM